MPTSAMRKQNSGFTLAELLVVVAIIGVLVAVSIPIFAGQYRKAKIATVRANIRAAKAAAFSAFMDTGYNSLSDTHGYYIYTISDGTAKLYYSASGSSNSWANPDAGTAGGKSSTKYTNSDYKKYIYKYIYVYIKTSNTQDEAKINSADIQTCPYYDSTKDELIYTPAKAYGSGN
jgi:prepilin-type N-terminal cleavage/methylation domain-containing protein